MRTNIPSRDDVVGYFSSLSNWGRWGREDQRGTLNLITDETVRQSSTLVRSGRRVSLGRTIKPGGTEPNPPLHFMISSGDSSPAHGFGGATDWFGLAFHGHSVTHLDAPSHIFWDGKTFNGLDAGRVTTARGAQVGSVELAANGIIARAVLADIPRHRGVARISGSEPIFSDELDSCLKSEGVQVHTGDVLLVRTGRDVAPATTDPHESGSVHPGLHAECLQWLHSHDISMLGADVAQEVQPSGYDDLVFPLHAVAIVAIGLWLIDNLFLEDLASACGDFGTWEFLFLLAPLRLKNTTGSPVNPIAVF